jgi:hypothetical protein
VIISLNGVNQMSFVMVKYGVLFEIRTDFLNIIQTSFGFKRVYIPLTVFEVLIFFFFFFARGRPARGLLQIARSGCRVNNNCLTLDS